MTQTKLSVSLVQGPRGLLGPKGPQGAPGPPVSTYFILIWINYLDSNWIKSVNMLFIHLLYSMV